jgi:hypothetical protein
MAISDNDATVAEQLQMILALKATDPDLEKAWQAYLKGDMDGFRSFVLGSAFYRNNNSIARTRKTAETNQPGVYAQDLNAYKVKSKKRLIQQGIQWTPGVEKQVEIGYQSGMNDDQVDQLIIKSGTMGKLGGSTMSTVSSLQSFANAYGVGNLLNTAYWDTKSTALFAGETTTDDIMNDIKNLSASAYPAYAEGIKNNVSLSALASNVTSTVANLLELDPDTVDFNNPLVKRIMGYVNPATGKQEVMPQWMVDKTVKSTDDWLYTNNAISTIDSLTTKVFSDWGLM